MIKLCQKKPPNRSEGFLRSALLGPSGGGGTITTGFVKQQQQPPSRAKNGGLMLPATQLPGRSGLLAIKARLSPTMSLFNRLETLVYQLESSRDFFADWPDRICQLIRAPKSASEQQQQQDSLGQQQQQQQENQQAAANSSSSSNSICWTGHNYGSYTKNLVEFGKPILPNHPELPAASSPPFNELVLAIIARLKVVKDQLARQSAKSPLTGFALLGARTQSALAGAIKSANLKRTVASGHQAHESQQAPLALLSKPEARMGLLAGGEAASLAGGHQQQQQQLQLDSQQQQRARQQQQQQQVIIDVPAAYALAASLPQTVQDEANEGANGSEPSADDSNTDESSSAASSLDDGSNADEFSSTEDDDEEPDDASSEDPINCKDKLCNVITSEGNSNSNNHNTNHANPPSSNSIAEAWLNHFSRLQPQPGQQLVLPAPPPPPGPPSIGEPDQQLHHQHGPYPGYITAQQPPIRIVTAGKSPYSTPTVVWDSSFTSATFEDSSATKQWPSSSACSALLTLANGGGQRWHLLLMTLSAAIWLTAASHLSGRRASH